MKVWLVHGAFNWGEGKKAWDTLRPTLRQYDMKPVNFSYGWVGPLTTVWRSKEAAKKLRDRMDPGDSVVCFSNGGLVVAKAIEKGLRPKRAVFIQPALARGFDFPRKKNILVLYNPDDWVVSASWLAFWNDWGRMGRYGPEASVESWNTREGKVPATGHFGWRKGKAAEYWAHKIAQEIKHGD